jgi:sporulation protein YlmC with PRC-barrel domain
MTRTSTALTVSLVSLALAAGASAQTPSRPGTNSKTQRDSNTQRDSSTQRDSVRSQDAERAAWSPQPTAIESSKLIGMKVRTTDGKDIGQIDQVIVNQSDGKVTHVVLNKGGILGVGGDKLVLTWRDVKLQHDVDNPDQWVAVVDQAKVDRAPKYEARKESESLPAASPRTTPSTKSSDTGKSRDTGKKY